MNKRIDWLSNKERFNEVYNSILNTDERRVETFLNKIKDLGSPSLTEYSELLETVNKEFRYNYDLRDGNVIYAIDMLENYGIWKVSYENFDVVINRLSKASGINF